MTLTKKQQLIIDTIQWILIGFLVCVCGYMYYRTGSELVTNESFEKDNTYVQIYESQKIEALKKENQALYDSIKKLKNVETAIEIKYKYLVKTDTIFVNEFKTLPDSIYTYHSTNDTIYTIINVKAADLKWVQSTTEINDKFTIINKEKDNQNYMTIDHSPNVSIESVSTWHRQSSGSKWYNRFHFGPQVGVGYGIMGKQADVFVGVGIQYNIK